MSLSGFVFFLLFVLALLGLLGFGAVLRVRVLILGLGVLAFDLLGEIVG